MKIALLDPVTRHDIERQLDLDVTFTVKHEDRYTIIEFEGEDEEVMYNYLATTYRVGHPLSELTLSVYTGKLVDVGKVGFGLYCDIGSDTDALIPLHALREAFGDQWSARDYIAHYGLVEGLCIDIELTKVEVGTERVWTRPSPEWMTRYLIDGTILVAGTRQSELEGAIANSPFARSLTIKRICETSFAIRCSEGIDPPGIVAYFGKRLHSARFGIVGDY